MAGLVITAPDTPSESEIQNCLADGVDVTRADCHKTLTSPLMEHGTALVFAVWVVGSAALVSPWAIASNTLPRAWAKTASWTGLRYIAGSLAVGAFIALMVVDYYLVKSCGDAAGRDSGYLELYAAPVLPLVTVALLRFRPTGAWVALLVASPFIGWVMTFAAGLHGEFVGQCGRF
jgi:hypothetical protein